MQRGEISSTYHHYNNFGILEYFHSLVSARPMARTGTKNSSSFATPTAGNTPKTPSSRLSLNGRDTPSLPTSGKPSSMGFGLFLSGYCDNKCRWNVSHLHRTNRVACRDGRRKDIKPICDTKNNWEKENVVAKPKKREKIGIA